MTGSFHEKLRLFDNLHYPHLPPSTLALFSCRVNSIWIMIVEVRNRFKGLALIECLMNYGWRFVTLYRRQGSGPSPRKRNTKRQNGCLRRPYNNCEKKRSEKQRKKGKIYPFECRVPKNIKER